MAKNKTRTIRQKGAIAKKYQEIFQGKRESANTVKEVKTTKYRGENK